MKDLNRYQVSVLEKLDSLIEKGGKFYKVNECAFELSICPDHLNRLCKRYNNQSVKARIDSKRYTKALKLLRMKDKYELKEISEILCFSETSNFTRFFKRRSGISPSEFRQ